MLRMLDLLVGMITRSNVLFLAVVKYFVFKLLYTRWARVQQRRTSRQDGVLGTNCPIPPNWNWTYNFLVKNQIGSFFYFRPLNFQRALGGFGGIIINNRAIIPIPFATPHDDIPIMIGDWYTSSHAALRRTLNGGKDLGMPNGVLIKI